MARVLLIEDDALLTRLVERLLARHGHEVRAAPDGVEGLRLFQVTRPDLVITDIYMPEKDGLATIRELRALEPTVRIIATSGGDLEVLDVLYAARVCGSVVQLPKPFEEATLLSAVTTALRGARA